MLARRRKGIKRTLGAGLLGGLVAWPVVAQQPAVTTVPPGKPLEIRVAPVTTPPPTVSMTLATRQGHGVPHRLGCCHTGGGNIDVAQPFADTVVITMMGVAVAVGGPCHPGAAGMDFELSQDFEVVFGKPEVKAAKITLEARAIGLLRSHKHGGVAELTHGQVGVRGVAGEVVALAMPDHCVAEGENLSINEHEGPVSIPISAGKYTLCQTVHFLASHRKSVFPCKASSVEFAPDPALDPLWISYWEPFHGASKKDFGFQVTIKVAEDSSGAAASPPAPAPDSKKLEVIPLEPKEVGNGAPIRKTGQTTVERIRYEPRMEINAKRR
jgi:hypothetical protein